MRACRLSAVLVLLLAGLQAPGEVRAQEVEPEEGQAAAEALKTGQYEEARRQYRALASRGGAHAVPYFETFLAVGAYEEGLQEAEALLRRAPDDAYLLHAQGRLLAAVGRYEEAERAFRQAYAQRPDLWRNLIALAELLEQTGRRREAFNAYAAVYQPYRQGQFRDADALAAAGRAAAHLEEFHEANGAFRTAYQLRADNLQTLYWWAELFRTKYNEADARRTYEEALQINPRHADLYVGLARTVGSYGEQEELARKALQINPRHVDALAILAELRILDGLYDEAGALLEEALAVNPSSLLALAHQAAIHHLKGDTARFAAVEAQALRVNPRAGDFYVTVVDDLTRRFRYPDAVELARKAVRVEPDNVRAYATLGTALLRLGETEEARRYLQASFERDPFNLFVGNTLTLIEEYADFDLQASEHFMLKIHGSEASVLGPEVLAVAEAAYDSLSARYPYRPAGKILLEAYNDATDFGVRVAGVPHLGLLGVCFGDVVAFNTPRAQGSEPYNWARTLWHELAHTMAIGTSDYHVPRWFTEGLSVYEEQRARPEWGREMELELFAAFDQGRLLPLAEIDRGFTRPSFPGQILLSYYHASKVVEHLVDRYGFDAVTGILSALGRGLSTEAAVQQVTGQDLATLDRGFQAGLRQERTRYAAVLDGLPDVLGQEDGSGILEKLTGPSENTFFQRLQEGNAALRDGNLERAEARFWQSIEAFPDFVGGGNAYEGLAAVYRRQERTDRLQEVLERYLRITEYGAAEARELAELYAASGDADRAAALYRRSLEVDPYDLAARTRLAELYASRGRHADAVRERRAVLALGPVDRADAYYRLALSLRQSGQHDQARRAVLQSLEVAPGFREAQRLLLEIVDNVP